MCYTIVVYLYRTKEIKTMKTYNEIIETVKTEIENKTLTSVRGCQKRIENLCNENNQSQNMFSIANIFGVA